LSSNVLPINPGGERPSARIEKNELVLDDFRERDPQVLALAKDAENLDALVHDCLAVGARAMTAAQATTDVAVVEKAFGEMTSTFTRGIDEFSDELETRTKELLDGEDGALPRSFEEFKGQLEELLGDTFDPDSKQSVIATFEQVMRKSTLDHLKAMRTLIDPDNEESPLGRYRSEIVKSVEKEAAKLQKAVEELKTQLAVDEAKAEMFELTTKKGFTFEDELEATLIEICEPHGDVAERVGGTPGARGKKGDFKVSLNPEDVAGQDVCFTVEAKNQQLSLRDTLKELDRCIANRGALAGVAVFAKHAQCPGASPFQCYGNRAVVVYESQEESDLALRLALAWARWVVRRQLASNTESVDLDRIGSLIDSARQALRTQSTIDRALTTSANKIGEAKGHLVSLVAEVEAALANIEGEIAA
jgi:hypothetical protein